jgi:hypothetical protein
MLIGTSRTNKNIVSSKFVGDYLVYLYNDFTTDCSSHPIFFAYINVISSCFEVPHALSSLAYMTAPFFVMWTLYSINGI